MPAPYEIFLPVLAASATLVVFLAAIVVCVMPVGFIVRRMLAREAERLWDAAAGRFRSPRRGKAVACWRAYSRIIDTATRRSACAAFHRERAGRAWLRIVRELHEHFAAGDGDDELDGSELQSVRRFVSFRRDGLRLLAGQMSRRFARKNIPVEEFLEFLSEEQKNAVGDPQSFRGHLRRFRARFGVSLFRYLHCVDGSEGQGGA